MIHVVLPVYLPARSVPALGGRDEGIAEPTSGSPRYSPACCRTGYGCAFIEASLELVGDEGLSTPGQRAAEIFAVPPWAIMIDTELESGQFAAVRAGRQHSVATSSSENSAKIRFSLKV